MNFSFSKIAIDLSGKEISDQDGSPLSVGRMLATTMVNQSKGDAMKFYDWAKRLYANEPINLDRSDVKTITTFVEGSETLTVLAKAQLLEILSKEHDA